MTSKHRMICPDCRAITSRRPTDTERLTWLLEVAALAAHLPERGWTDLEKRADIDRLMREEARRAR